MKIFNPEAAMSKLRGVDTNQLFDETIVGGIISGPGNDAVKCYSHEGCSVVTRKGSWTKETC